MELARHHDADPTFDRHAHTRLEDLSKIVDRLPDLWVSHALPTSAVSEGPNGTTPNHRESSPGRSQAAPSGHTDRFHGMICPSLMWTIRPADCRLRLFIVSHQQERRAVPLHVVEQEPHDLAGGGRVKVAGWLIGQQDLGTVDERPGDRDPLVLAPRKARSVGGQASETQSNCL